MLELMEYCVAMFDNPKYPKVSQWAVRFLPNGSYPSNNLYIFFDSSGKELPEYRIKNSCTAKYVAEVLQKVISAQGKGVPRKEYAKCVIDIERAGKLLEIGYYDAANELYGNVAKMKYKVEPEFVKASKEKVKEIEKKIEEEIETAKEKAENGEKKEALISLRELEAGCKKHALNKKIRELAATIEKEAGMDEAKKEAEKLSAARQLYFTAEKYLIEGNKKSAKTAFTRLRLMAKGTEYEEKAASRLEELKD